MIFTQTLISFTCLAFPGNTTTWVPSESFQNDDSQNICLQTCIKPFMALFSEHPRVFKEMNTFSKIPSILIINVWCISFLLKNTGKANILPNPTANSLDQQINVICLICH
jgi:hypothetical protein